jgi:hypothetical protein
VERLKAEGLTSGAMAISFSRRLIRPIQDWVHPTYEYWVQSDPTRVAKCKVSKEEMVARVKGIFAGCIHNQERSYKLRASADALVTLQQHIEEHIFDSSVGRDDDAPTARRASPKVATSAPRHTRQMAGKSPLPRPRPQSPPPRRQRPRRKGRGSGLLCQRT